MKNHDFTAVTWTLGQCWWAC